MCWVNPQVNGTPARGGEVDVTIPPPKLPPGKTLSNTGVFALADIPKVGVGALKNGRVWNPPLGYSPDPKVRPRAVGADIPRVNPGLIPKIGG